MSTKVYLTMHCDIAKRHIPISYEVIYFDKSPKLGNCRCEVHAGSQCASCPIKGKKRSFVSEHFTNIYKKEFCAV